MTLRFTLGTALAVALLALAAGTAGSHPPHGDSQKQGDININIYLSGVNLSGSVGNVGGFKMPIQPGATFGGGGNGTATAQPQPMPNFRGTPLAGNQPNLGGGQQGANRFQGGQAGILGRDPRGGQQGGLILPGQLVPQGGGQVAQGHGGKGKDHPEKGGKAGEQHGKAGDHGKGKDHPGKGEKGQGGANVLPGVLPGGVAPGLPLLPNVPQLPNADHGKGKGNDPGKGKGNKGK